ncbi:putative bifunctional diguanylate cyclase/phosphodiesterase [Ferribacterium limneticum]|uniref:putative bifunctional diguanylate cyclase/phosphodiesterase n=1 Tax=Ferribacterium limneticum TaxID=76259 RepID=UPI001CFC40D9|nr:EAL domain-containing protein [Ferribacterium limneticum]UCV30130.1 EAL domain-containing protein [Ferribacterium limneticum]UCV34049.1 EAL domain-containing protein [Ferribacterium limneticum]
MFNLSRYFSTVSFILIVLAAGVLGPLYQRLSLLQLQNLAESRNVAMAQVFQNSLQAPLASLIGDAVGRDIHSLQLSDETRHLQASVLDLMRNTAVIKIKVYNRLGNTIFSTDSGQIGESKLENAGFRTAINGAITSELTHRNTIDTFEGRLVEVDVLSSYIPIVGKDRSVEGVFELYQNVTPFVAQLNRNLWWVTAGVVLVFAALYLMQFLVVRRAQGILEDQEGRIKAARDTLEIQVAARTEELKRTNSQLEGEISERRQAQSKLNYLAYHDPLTGLANRRCFIERLEESLRETARHGERLAVLFIDLDQFKQVNDSLGHGVGDELLVSVAARLSEHVRLIDMLARLGGDEFICLMEAVRDEDEVELLAREILGAFEYPFKLGDHELYLTASVGISLCPADAHSVLDLMRNADTAMYRAKMLGRGNFHFYTAEMTREAQERIQMENLLRRALDNGELSVHLQPQVEARSGQLVGAEALVRWNSPELGLVMPMRFIPLAEDSGLIVGLGNWVLRETCRQFMQWRMSGFELPQVSVNLSVKQLERPEFIDVLGEILDETGMDPTCLKLELTESVVMAVGDAFTPLERLRDLGISLALDDFGTGYSSLSYLKMLPVQQLKIDRSFVEGIGRNTGDEAIIRTIMELARSLGFEVVAEGVETVEQADFLAALGCEQLQGYLHGKAVAPAEFRARWSVGP